jgi:hypothetical protein
MKNPIGFKLSLLLVAFCGLAVAGIASAVQPSGAQYAKAIFAVPSAMAPGVPTKVALAGAASAGTTLTTSGACVRISCTVSCSYRVTTGSSTATTDDNQLPANTPERFCLLNTDNTVTFYSASAGSAYVSVVKGAP